MQHYIGGDRAASDRYNTTCSCAAQCTFLKESIQLDSYVTTVEVAYAYNATARSVLEHWARPNSYELSPAPTVTELGRHAR